MRGAVATLGMRYACLVQCLKPSRHYAHLMSGKCRSLSIKDTLLTYRGHWETLITMVVTQAECRKWMQTHRDTQKHTHRHAHSEANITPFEAKKKKQSTGNKLRVVLYTTHCAAQVKHIRTAGVEAFPWFLSWFHRRDWNASNFEWGYSYKILEQWGYFSGKKHISVGKVSSMNGSEKASF